MHDFSWALARLLGMNGSPVHITVGDDDPSGPVLAAFGGILNTGQAMDEDAEGEADEVVVLSIEHVTQGNRVGALFVHRSQFRNAQRDEDGVVRISLGALTLCIEPLHSELSRG